MFFQNETTDTPAADAVTETNPAATDVVAGAATDAATSEATTTATEALDLTDPSGWSDLFATSFHNAFDQIIDMTPRVVAMVVVLTVGFLIAKVVAKMAEQISKAVGLQAGAERSGLADSMKQVGIHPSVSVILGRIVFWMLMCVFLTAGFNVLGLETLSTTLQTVVAYIPNLLVAAVVVIVGLLVAALIRGVVATSADRVGITYAERLAAGCYYVLALMTFIAAFDQLGIRFELFREMLLIAFAAVALGFGLAAGLGGRDVMGGILAGYYTRQRLHPGDHVDVAGLEGTVREVGPVATVIETEHKGLLTRHSVPNTKMLAEAVR